MMMDELTHLHTIYLGFLSLRTYPRLLRFIGEARPLLHRLSLAFETGLGQALDRETHDALFPYLEQLEVHRLVFDVGDVR